jgi:uncharacterized membrane-anchored protein
MSKPQWVRLHSKLWMVLLLAQMLFLIGITLSFYAVGWFGREIRLQTIPIDPRDLLYGDYVTLNYDINHIKTSLWQGVGNISKQGKTIYVKLKLDVKSKNGTYEAVGIYDQKPSFNDGEVILKGHTDYSDNNIIHVKYGLETYYVQENTGKTLEEQAGNLVSKVKVAPWGRAVLENVELPH